MGTLDGKVALVTAGSGGIGRGIVESLLAEGASVAITGRSAEKGKRVLGELGAPERTAFFAGDARELDDVAGWVAATVEQFGSIDILVNNAGGSDGFAQVHELTDEAWDNAFTFIMDSVFWATRAALKHMLAQGGGRIVNISSVEGKMGNKATVSHYISAKHAVNGFTKAVAYEYGRQGITCNAICPGVVETELTKEVGPVFAAENGMTYEEYLADYAKDAATGEMNTAEQIGATAAFLVGPAGAGITGALWNVDGGTAPY